MADHASPVIQQQVTWVYTHDLARTTTFYASTLGLERVLDQGSCHIYRSAPNAFVGVCQVRPGREVEPRGVVITLVTPEVDAWYQRLRGMGVHLEGPPRHSEPFNVYAFFARDPNGYRIEFQTFLDPAWPEPNR